MPIGLVLILLVIVGAGAYAAGARSRGLEVNGATDRVIEFTGPVVEKMTMESRMTMCNMAIEAGGTSGICFPDMTTVEYLWKFIKDEFESKEDVLNNMDILRDLYFFV